MEILNGVVLIENTSAKVQRISLENPLHVTIIRQEYSFKLLREQSRLKKNFYIILNKIYMVEQTTRNELIPKNLY